MNKIYQRIDWENYPSSATPLNEDNLNKMDYAIDKLDDRIVTHETTKLNTATGNTLVKNVTFNETTGVFTIEKLSGSKITINTALEKISTNFHFNPTTQKLILTLIDGTTQEIDLSALLTQYEFLESDTITFTIDASGKVKANILNGSITGEKLEPNYLANVTLQAKNAKTSADNAKTSEQLAYQYAEEAKESASQTAKSDAKNITYDNTESGLSATNVKDALDEVAQGSVSALTTDTTITDSTNAPLIYGKFKGYTEQQTYSGKNLMKVEKSGNSWQCDVSVADDGKITLTNTATTGVAYGRAGLITFKANTPYTISVHNASNLKDITFFKPGMSESVNIAYTHSNVTVTPSSDVEAELIVYMNDISTVGNKTIVYVQVEEGTTATPYEPYVGGTASPNPEYPQEINGLAKNGAIEVKTARKNLLKNIATTKTINGVTFTVNDDKSITANGTATAEIIIGVGNFKPKPNKTYIFTANSKTLSSSEYWRAYSYIANIDGVKAWRSDSPSNNYSYEFTPLTDTTIYNNIYIESGMTVNNLKFYPMIRPVEITDDTYEPYQVKTTAAIPTDAPLYEGDYIEIYADGSGRLVRAMAEVVFDGSTDETWLYGGTDDGIANTFKKDISDVKRNIWMNVNEQFCSHFKVDAPGYRTYDCFSFNNTKTLVIQYSGATDVATFKTWLQSNPVTVVYELAEPTEIELTAEQVAEFKKLYTFEPITNVLCDGEVEIQYYKNTTSGVAVSKIHSRVNELENHPAIIKPYKHIIITDSYGNPVIPNGGGTITPFINRLPALMGWSSNDYKASYQDGAGFGNGLFLSQLKTLRNSMTSAEAEEYTNIVVLGGYNDWQQTFISLKTAMQTFCDYAKTNFPNAIIQIGYISGSRRAGDRYNLKIVPLNTYRCASLVGAVYLRNLEYVLHDNCYFLTGNNQYQHPLDIGHELLAPFIAEALKTGECTVARQHTRYKVTFASGITETVALYITSSQVNDQLTIANEVAFMTFNSNKTINDAEYFNIGTLPSECHIIGSYQSYEGNYPITVAYTDSADNSGVCTASIHFNGRTGDTGNVTVQLCLYTGGKTLTLKSICIYANSGLLSSNEC